MCGLLRREDSDARGVPVDEVASTHRTDFPGTERAGEWYRTEHRFDEGGVVVGRPEEAGTPAVAREQERSRAGAGRLEQHPKVFVGRRGVTHQELHGLPDLEPVADRDRAVGLIDAEQIADEEVA